jgi:PST family polysaccharide transporter
MILKNSFFSLLGKASEAIITIGGLSILGRQLRPEDFGVFAIILSVQAFFQPFVDMGFGPAFVKAKEESDSLKNLFYSLNFFVGALNMSFLIIFSFFVGSYYDQEGLQAFMIVFSFSVFFNALSRQRNAQLLREQNYKAIAFISISTSFLATGVAIAFAISGFGVWSLVAKALALSILKFMLFKGLVRKNYKIDLSKIKQHKKDLSFGLKLLLIRLVNGLSNSLDKLLFGKFFGTELLGQYSNSMSIVRMIDNNVRVPLTSVLFSHVERLPKEKRKRSSLKLSLKMATLPILACLGLVVFGEQIIIILLGEQWIEASVFIPFIAFFGLGQVFKGISSTLFMIADRLNRFLTLNMVSFCVLIVAAYLGFSQMNALLFVKALSFGYFGFWVIIFGTRLFRLNLSL